MLDYTTFIILIATTFVVAFISLRFPLIGIFMLLIDVATLFDTLSTGNVIMGYAYNGTYTTIPIVQQMTELQYLGLIVIIVCVAGVLIGILKE